MVLKQRSVKLLVLVFVLARAVGTETHYVDLDSPSDLRRGRKDFMLVEVVDYPPGDSPLASIFAGCC